MVHVRTVTSMSAPASFPSDQIIVGTADESHDGRSQTYPLSNSRKLDVLCGATQADTARLIDTSERLVSAKDFIKGVREHAQTKPKETIYPGENFLKLATYLSKSSTLVPPSSRSEGVEPPYFGTLYSLKACKSTDNFPSEDVRNPADLRIVDEKLKTKAEGLTNQILFLRGYPTPDWISTIASFFGVDPEYFRQHLDFSLFAYQNWFSTPCLPSTSNDVVRLRVTTVARREFNLPVNGLEHARQETRDSMTAFTQRLSDGLTKHDVNVGTSIVRKFSVLDNRYFSLEQDISICFCSNEQNWKLIAWLDSGIDLSKGLPGPWLAAHTNQGDSYEVQRMQLFYQIPVIRNDPRRAMRNRLSEESLRKLQERVSSFNQSHALLNLDYGRHFDGLHVFDDPFYSIEPIFRYKALAETQFLNLVETILRKDFELVNFTKPMGAGFGRSAIYLDTLRAYHANFVFHRELLESHARDLREELRSIDRRGGPHWFRSQSKEVIAAVKVLEEDYKWLEERAKALSALCDRGMKDIHDKSTLAESIKSNELAKRVNQLTRIATLLSIIYIPLSFTTGFFGMNTASFGQGTLPLWVWAAVSIPILALSFFTFYFVQIKNWIGSVMKPSRHIHAEGGPGKDWTWWT